MRRQAWVWMVVGLLGVHPCGWGSPAKVISLWPDQAPGDTEVLGAEADTTKSSDRMVGGRPVLRIGNVSRPEITIFSPIPSKRNGTAVMVCPGGGYNILAMDLEGTEICEWLNGQGITAVLLKYRVPKRPGLDKHTAAFQDAQRAMGLLRERAGEFEINPRRLGVLGFSAGGHLAALLSNHSNERTYPPVDEADKLACRPDFSVLIYPAYLTVKDKGDAIAPELDISTNTPPTFVVMAQDDPVRVENVLFYGLALHQNKVPFELHVYPHGGHGYGLRRSPEPITRWPDRALEWMRSRGLVSAER